MKQKKVNTNRYQLVQRMDLTIASEAGGKELKRLFDLAEQVRAAFVGLTNDLFDHIEVEPEKWSDERVMIKLTGSTFISLKAGFAFEFLNSSVFSYRPKDNEPWELSVETDDGFGSGMSITALTPRECVRGMITQRKKYLKEQLASLNRFRDFEDYTYCRHICH